MENPDRGGPGLSSDKGQAETAQPDSALDRQHQDRPVDVRLAWLLRCASRYDMLRAGMMTVEEVFDVNFVCDLLEAIPDICPCHIDIIRHFDRACYTLRRDRLRKALRERVT